MNNASYTRKREHFSAPPQVISNNGYCCAESDYIVTNAGPDGMTTFCYAYTVCHETVVSIPVTIKYHN